MSERDLNSIFFVAFFTLLPGLLMASLAYGGVLGFFSFIGVLFGIPLLYHRREARKRALSWSG